MESSKDIAKFGFEPTLYVLDITVREKERDGRIERHSEDRAQMVAVFDDDDGFGGNRNREFVIDQSHPGLMDLFGKQVRRDYLSQDPAYEVVRTGRGYSVMAWDSYWEAWYDDVRRPKRGT